MCISWILRIDNNKYALKTDRIYNSNDSSWSINAVCRCKKVWSFNTQNNTRNLWNAAEGVKPSHWWCKSLTVVKLRSFRWITWASRNSLPLTETSQVALRWQIGGSYIQAVRRHHKQPCCPFPHPGTMAGGTNGLQSGRTTHGDWCNGNIISPWIMVIIHLSELSVIRAFLSGPTYL